MNHVRSFSRFAVAVVACSSAVVPATFATDTSAVVLTGGSNGGVSSQTTIFGFDFTPAADLTVTALGVMDTVPFTGSGTGDGLATAMPVGLYRVDSPFSGTLLRQADLPAGTSTTFIDDFRYADVTPVELEAGQTYRILTIYLSSGSEGLRSSFLTDVSIDPAITNFQSVAAQSNLYTELQFAGTPFGGGTVHASGPNFRFATQATCPADCDENGLLNVDDVDCFVSFFLAGDLAADIDGSGVLNLDDIDAFIGSFLSGCP